MDVVKEIISTENPHRVWYKPCEIANIEYGARCIAIEKDDIKQKIVFVDKKEYDDEEFVILGQLHREDGPAAILLRDSKINYYFLNGVKLTKEVWFDKLTPEQRAEVLWHLDE